MVANGEASTALRCYCVYVVVLAMNGTSEAFLHAVASEDQLKRSNNSLVLFSFIYVVLNILLIRSADAVGLIFANGLNEKVPSELKKAIMQGRTDKKLTQAQLAQMINEKPHIIQEYESGKAIPNQQIITKLERALGVKLRGKK